MQIGEYTLANSDKIERAINGTVIDQGAIKGGVGTDASEAEIIAEYDRLGGLILKDGKYKVKTGSFWDFKNKAAFKKPKPMLLFNINGETIEVDADEPLPLEVRASEQAKATRKKRGAAKGKGKGKAKKDAEEDTEEDDESEESEDNDENAEEGELA